MCYLQDSLPQNPRWDDGTLSQLLYYMYVSIVEHITFISVFYLLYTPLSHHTTNNVKSTVKGNTGDDHTLTGTNQMYFALSFPEIGKLMAIVLRTWEGGM
jgi:hypothetical protein